MNKPIQVLLSDIERYPNLIDRILDGPPKPRPFSPPPESSSSNSWSKLRTLALRKDGKVMRHYS